jgi:hypothetical protein
LVMAAVVLVESFPYLPEVRLRPVKLEDQYL